MLAYYLQLQNWLEAQEGQGLVEYALIIALVSIALTGALIALAGGINNVFTTIRGSFP